MTKNSGTPKTLGDLVTRLDEITYAHRESIDGGESMYGEIYDLLATFVPVTGQDAKIERLLPGAVLAVPAPPVSVPDIPPVPARVSATQQVFDTQLAGLRRSASASAEELLRHVDDACHTLRASGMAPNLASVRATLDVLEGTVNSLATLEVLRDRVRAEQRRRAAGLEEL